MPLSMILLGLAALAAPASSLTLSQALAPVKVQKGPRQPR